MGAGDAQPTVTETVIHATRDGDWLLPQELHALALSAAAVEGDLTVSLAHVDYLDASTLQILLALAAERKKCGRGLRLADASASLARWFEYAGGRESISPEREP